MPEQRAASAQGGAKEDARRAMAALVSKRIEVNDFFSGMASALSGGTPQFKALKQGGFNVPEENLAPLFEYLQFCLKQVVADNEMGALLEGLDGQFITPGPGGDPIRNPAVLPTGKNMHALDPQAIPQLLSTRLDKEQEDARDALSDAAARAASRAAATPAQPAVLPARGQLAQLRLRTTPLGRDRRARGRVARSHHGLRQQLRLVPRRLLRGLDGSRTPRRDALDDADFWRGLRDAVYDGQQAPLARFDEFCANCREAGPALRRLASGQVVARDGHDAPRALLEARLQRRRHRGPPRAACELSLIHISEPTRPY